MSDENNLSTNIEKLSELIELAKKDNKPHLEEVIENVLRQSNFTILKNEELNKSLTEAINLFPIHIDFSEEQLENSRKSSRKDLRLEIIKDYFFKLIFTIINVFLLIIVLYPFMHKAVKMVITGTAKHTNNSEVYNELNAIVVFLIIGGWMLAGYIYRRFLSKKSHMLYDKGLIIANVLILIGLTFYAWMLPGLQTQIKDFFFKSSENMTLFVVLKMLFSSEGLGIFIIPAWIFSTLLTVIEIRKYE